MLIFLNFQILHDDFLILHGLFQIFHLTILKLYLIRTILKPRFSPKTLYRYPKNQAPGGSYLEILYFENLNFLD